MGFPYPIFNSRVMKGGSLPFGDKVTSLSPFLWWKMNEASGTAIEDYQVGGSDHDGTLTIGSGALGAEGIGDGGTSITFDGTATQIVVSGNPSLSLPASGTLAFWWKSGATSIWTDNTLRQMRFDRADNANYVRLAKTTSNVLQLLYRAGGGTAVTVEITPNTSADWFLFAGTWSPSGTAVYQVLKGGATVVSNTGGTSGTWSDGGALWQVPGASTYTGSLAHVMIFPTALSQAQLQELARI